jgi:hypothetical protein
VHFSVGICLPTCLLPECRFRDRDDPETLASVLNLKKQLGELKAFDDDRILSHQQIADQVFSHEFLPFIEPDMTLEDNFDKLIEILGQCEDQARALRLQHAVYLVRMAVMEVTDRSLDHTSKSADASGSARRIFTPRQT